MPTVPSAFPTAKRSGLLQLKAKQVAACPAPPSMVAAGLGDLQPRSKICTSPGEEIFSMSQDICTSQLMVLNKLKRQQIPEIYYSQGTAGN